MTPDALGPYVADNLNITRHIVKEYGKYAMGKEEVTLISALVPGVMAQTGMETVEIIRGVVKRRIRMSSLRWMPWRPETPNA